MLLHAMHLQIPAEPHKRPYQYQTRFRVLADGTVGGFLYKSPLDNLRSTAVNPPRIREVKTMKKLGLKLSALKNTYAQDLIEYALMAGFVALTTAAIIPGVASSVSTIFSQVASVMPVGSAQVTAATN